MKSKMILGVLLLANLVLGAQDKILKRDGTLLSGKVLSDTPTEVAIRQDSVSAATQVPLTSIRYIKHQIGYLDAVGQSGLVYRSWSPRVVLRTREIELNKPTARIYPYRANYFHIGVGNIWFNEFSLAYERLFDEGKIGLKIPVKVNFRDLDNEFATYQYSDEKVATSFGLDVNFYPGRQGFFRYFTGLGLRMGDYLYQETTFNEDESAYTGESYTAKFKGLVINNGIMIKPFSWLGINAVMGLGVISVSDDSNSSNKNYSKSRLFVDPQLNLTIGL